MENEVLQEFGMMFGGKGTTLRVKRIKKLLEERKVDLNAFVTL